MVTKLEKSLAKLIFKVYINYCTLKYVVMVSNCECLTLKSILINEGESNWKLPKMFAGKNL